MLAAGSHRRLLLHSQAASTLQCSVRNSKDMAGQKDIPDPISRAWMILLVTASTSPFTSKKGVPFPSCERSSTGSQWVAQLLWSWHCECHRPSSVRCNALEEMIDAKGHSWVFKSTFQVVCRHHDGVHDVSEGLPPSPSWWIILMCLSSTLHAGGIPTALRVCSSQGPSFAFTPRETPVGSNVWHWKLPWSFQSSPNSQSSPTAAAMTSEFYG